MKLVQVLVNDHVHYGRFVGKTNFQLPSHRKEVIQPHFPVRLPCYDFTPLTEPTFVTALLCRLDQ